MQHHEIGRPEGKTSLPLHSDHAVSTRRAPPSNVEAEQTVIGAVLADNGIFHTIKHRVGAHHFSKDTHCRIWKVISTLVKNHSLADPTLVIDWLDERELGRDRMLDYLKNMAMVADRESAITCAQIVRDLGVQRQTIRAMEKIIAAAYDTSYNNPLSKVIQDGLDDLYRIRDDAARWGSRA